MAEHNEFVLVSTNILGVVENKENEVQGLAIEVLERAAKRFDFSYKLEFYPWKRALKVMARARADGIIGVYYSDSRARFMDYANQPIYVDNQLLISLKSKRLSWNGQSEKLFHHSVALLLGGDYGPLFENGKVNVVKVGTSQQQFSMLAKGRVDFIPNNPRVSSGLIAHLGLRNKLTFHQPALSMKPGYFAAAKGSNFEAILSKLDRVIIEMKKTGEFQKLTEKYITQLVI